jgi:hypothetical protein
MVLETCNAGRGGERQQPIPVRDAVQVQRISGNFLAARLLVGRFPGSPIETGRKNSGKQDVTPMVPSPLPGPCPYPSISGAMRPRGVYELRTRPKKTRIPCGLQVRHGNDQSPQTGQWNHPTHGNRAGAKRKGRPTPGSQNPSTSSCSGWGARRATPEELLRLDAFFAAPQCRLLSTMRYQFGGHLETPSVRPLEEETPR